MASVIWFTVRRFRPSWSATPARDSYGSVPWASDHTDSVVGSLSTLAGFSPGKRTVKRVPSTPSAAATFPTEELGSLQ